MDMKTQKALHILAVEMDRIKNSVLPFDAFNIETAIINIINESPSKKKFKKTLDSSKGKV